MNYFTNVNGVSLPCSVIPQSQLFAAEGAKLLRAEENSIEGSTGNTATAFKEQDALNWVKNDKRRMLHVVYRVGDLEKTIKYAFS